MLAENNIKSMDAQKRQHVSLLFFWENQSKVVVLKHGVSLLSITFHLSSSDT